MREVYGPTPFVVVLEHHIDGHLHVHFGYARFLNVDHVRACWPHGFVELRRLKVKSRQRMGARESARRCAIYLAKYISKEHHDPSAKSYSTTRGLVPPPRRERYMTRDDALKALILANRGRLWASSWSSEDVDDWEAPPVLILFWDDA
jgi:hypothetical protein